MATSYRILGQLAPAAAVSGGNTLYTVTAPVTNAVVSTIAISNRGTSAASYRIALRQGGAALDSKQYLAYDVTLPANSTTSYTLGITLATTDMITVYASSANLTFQAFGSEIQ